MTTIDEATISAVMAAMGRKGKGIPKPKSAENGKKGGRPRKKKETKE